MAGVGAADDQFGGASGIRCSGNACFPAKGLPTLAGNSCEERTPGASDLKQVSEWHHILVWVQTWDAAEYLRVQEVRLPAETVAQQERPKEGTDQSRRELGNFPS